MSSLADQIAKLTNPAPEIYDPETDVHDETSAKLCDKSKLDYELSEQVDRLKSTNVSLLDEVDSKYAGKPVKKSELEGYFEDTFEDSSIEEDNDEEDTNEKLSGLKSKHIQDLISSHEDSNVKEEIEDDNEEDSEKEESEDDDDGEDEDENNEESSEASDDGDDMVQNFSNIDVSGEIQKGKAVTAQQELWNRLCECRIKLQKLLAISNKLPQFDIWNAFKQSSDNVYKENITKSFKSINSLLSNLIELQTELINADSELSCEISAASKNLTQGDDDNEEIPSDSDNEKEEVSAKLEKVKSPKRKLKVHEYDAFLSKRHKSLTPFRNSIIQRWDEKTRLSSGRMTQKSFSAFDQSAVKQIEQILQDKDRLIKRTQLKRSLYHIFGKDDLFCSTTEMAENELNKDYDPEIFDDDDFYRQLLKDVIESKSVGVDPAILSKQQEIQKIRSKIRRKVDTKASKGRKIRYDVHPKIVNYMAPVTTCQMSDFARDNLFNSLFLPPGTVAKT